MTQSITARQTPQVCVVVYRKISTGEVDVTLHTTQEDADIFAKLYSERRHDWEILFNGWRGV
jgi:hypothetical protein